MAGESQSSSRQRLRPLRPENWRIGLCCQIGKERDRTPLNRRRACLAGCGKRVFGPLSTDAILHYDVFYQAMNTEYWCPELVFPQPASAALMFLLLNASANC